MKTPRELEVPEEEDIELVRQKRIHQNQIVLGDLAVTTTGSLPKCRKLVKDLLKDKEVKNYLSI